MRAAGRATVEEQLIFTHLANRIERSLLRIIQPQQA